MTLPHSPQEILVAHERWATSAILDACRPLSEEQLHRPFEMGLGSLHDTIAHDILVVRRWTDLLAQRGERPNLDVSVKRSVDELAALHKEASDDFAEHALKDPADILAGERGGRPYSFSRGGVVTHVTTHNMHHRAQCLNMLRRLGVDPLPRVSVVEWMLSQGK